MIDNLLHLEINATHLHSRCLIPLQNEALNEQILPVFHQNAVAMSRSSLKYLTDLFSVGAIGNSLSSWRSLHGALQDQHHETWWSVHPGGHSPMADNVSNRASQPHALPYHTKSYSSARPAAQSVLTVSAENRQLIMAKRATAVTNGPP